MTKPAPPAVREEAAQLARQGLSTRAISICVGYAPTTVYEWVGPLLRDKRPPHKVATRKAALAAFRAGGKTLTQVADAHGVSRRTLVRWVQEAATS